MPVFQVPPEFAAALLGVVAYVVTQGLKDLSAFLAQYPALAWIEIGGWGSAIAGFLVTGLMFYVNLGVGAVPGSFQPLLPLVFQFLIGLFSAYGSHLTVKAVAGQA